MATQKTMKALKGLTKDELVRKERDLQKELFDARMKKTTGQLENTGMLWRLRKDIARVKMLAATAAKGQGK